MAEHHVVTIGVTEHEDHASTLSIECSCGAYMDTGDRDFTIDHLADLEGNLDHRSTQQE